MQVGAHHHSTQLQATLVVTAVMAVVMLLAVTEAAAVVLGVAVEVVLVGQPQGETALGGEFPLNSGHHQRNFNCSDEVQHLTWPLFFTLRYTQSSSSRK